MTLKTKSFREGGTFDGPISAPSVSISGQAAKKAGDTIVFEETHNYVINASGNTTSVFVPFAVAEGAGNVLELARVLSRCSSGTPTIKVQQKTGAGAFADVTGFTGISVSSTQAETNPTDVAVTDKDEFQVVCTAGSWTGWIYVTLVFKRTVTL